MRRKSIRITVVIYLFLLIQSVLGFASELQEQPEILQQFVKNENVRHAGIGFYAVDLSNGQVIGAYQEEMAIVPASTMKIVTSAAALELLGSDYVFPTKIFYDGKMKSNGTLDGNLYIEGKGDPTLGSAGISKPPRAFLNEWKEAIEQRGIKKITGDIIVLDGLFGYEGLSGKWLWEDFGTDYAPGTYGISIFDNIYTLYVRSGEVGTVPYIIGTEPIIPHLNLENQLIVSADPKNDVSVRGVPLSYQRSLKGEVPANQEKIAIKSDIPDPGLFLGEYLVMYLRENGIKVEGKGTTGRQRLTRIEPTDELVTTISIPMKEIVQVLMHRSDNHYAEHLYHILPIEKNTNVVNFWKEKGLNTNSLMMRDGSGLSPQDTLSAKLLVDILSYMETNRQGEYKELFPKTGQEGTVKNFLKNTSLDGRGYIKTGSMSGVQSYAGYIEVDGKEYAFALLVNHWNGERSELRKQIEKLLIGLFTKSSGA